MPRRGTAPLTAPPRESRGRIHLTGPNPTDPVDIRANMPAHLDDVKAAVASVELCREVPNSTALSPFTRREIMPRITIGNTMAPCMVIGERAGALLKTEHGL
jgi:choline dehydrogenase-like flavoprotein